MFVRGLIARRLRRVDTRPGRRRDTQKGGAMSSRPSASDFLTNLDQPMPLGEKLTKLVRNLWRRVALRQDCCGHLGEPGC